MRQGNRPSIVSLTLVCVSLGQWPVQWLSGDDDAKNPRSSKDKRHGTFPTFPSNVVAFPYRLGIALLCLYNMFKQSNLTFLSGHDLGNHLLPWWRSTPVQRRMQQDDRESGQPRRRGNSSRHLTHQVMVHKSKCLVFGSPSPCEKQVALESQMATARLSWRIFASFAWLSNGPVHLCNHPSQSVCQCQLKSLLWDRNVGCRASVQWSHSQDGGLIDILVWIQTLHGTWTADPAIMLRMIWILLIGMADSMVAFRIMLKWRIAVASNLCSFVLVRSAFLTWQTTGLLLKPLITLFSSSARVGIPWKMPGMTKRGGKWTRLSSCHKWQTRKRRDLTRLASLEVKMCSPCDISTAWNESSMISRQVTPAAVRLSRRKAGNKLWVPRATGQPLMVAKLWWRTD